MSSKSDKAIKTRAKLKSMGIKTWRRKGEFVFEFRPEILDEAKQLGFVIDILEVGGGSLPLPALADHMDKQAALEHYWSTAAEIARFELEEAKGKWNVWYMERYLWAFNHLKDLEGIPKPTKLEVESTIYDKYKKQYKKFQHHLRKLEKNHRILSNACHAAIITKGEMMRSLRNIIQGGDMDNIKVRRTKVVEVKL